MIRRSKLLSEDRKDALSRVLPDLNKKQIKELEKILKAEDKMISESAKATIGIAIENKDVDAVRDLDNFLHESERILRKEEEKAERDQEEQDTESMFSNYT